MRFIFSLFLFAFSGIAVAADGYWKLGSSVGSSMASVCSAEFNSGKYGAVRGAIQVGEMHCQATVVSPSGASVNTVVFNPSYFRCSETKPESKEVVVAADEFGFPTENPSNSSSENGACAMAPDTYPDGSPKPENCISNGDGTATCSWPHSPTGETDPCIDGCAPPEPEPEPEPEPTDPDEPDEPDNPDEPGGNGGNTGGNNGGNTGGGNNSGGNTGGNNSGGGSSGGGSDNGGGGGSCTGDNSCNDNGSDDDSTGVPGPSTKLHRPDAGSFNGPGGAGTEWDEKLDEVKEELKDKVAEKIDAVKGLLDINISGGGGGLPCVKLPFFGSSLDFCLDMYSDTLSYLRYVLLFMAAVFAALIVFKD